jgi:hypothetical protein
MVTFDDPYFENSAGRPQKLSGAFFDMFRGLVLCSELVKCIVLKGSILLQCESIKSGKSECRLATPLSLFKQHDRGGHDSSPLAGFIPLC